MNTGNPADDDSIERIVRFNEGAIQSLPRLEALQDQYVSVRAETVEPSLLLIYAETERKDALALAAALKTQLAAHGCDWPLHDWHQVRVGESLESTRRVWLQDASLVLVLTSPALIAVLKQGEVRLETGRPLLPLALRRVEPEQLEGTPLAGLSVFPRQGDDPWTARTRARRDEWIGAAARQVLDWTRHQGGKRPGRADLRDLLARVPQFRGDDCDDARYVLQYIKGRADPEGRPAVEFLLDWLRDPRGDVFCAVFGELGMGKTTLCQRLTRVLLDLRETELGLPLPLYLDLRGVNSVGWDWTRGAPDLDPLLGHLLATAYNIPEGEARPDAGQVRELAQRQGGLILLDGLDEVMNRLTPEQCRLFIQRLWGLLPPILWKPPARLPPEEAQAWKRPPGVGRLIMTCRSHFFRTIADQINALDGQQRESVGRDDYLWVNLLPFTGGQVETYFRQVFADDPERARRVIAMLDEVHDLRELGSRPYNLRLIQDQVEALESLQREGRRIEIADLYDGLVGQWTRRDDPKHRLSRDHKLVLMERLALRLWSEQSGDLRYTALEDWLSDQILSDPRWERIDYRAYLNQPGGAEILKEDLRNATFLVREGEDRFRFAHTSIMEFFLARALHRALVDDRLDDWAVPVPSPETLDFLGGLIASRESAACLAGLARIRARYRPRASELALAYALYAYAEDRPGADFAGFQLQGASLRFQRWGGREDRPMDWRGADLSGAELKGGRFVDCDFRGVRFDGADLARTRFDRCRWDGVSARGVDLTGATLSQCPATGTDLTNAQFYQSHWLGDLPVSVRAVPPAVFSSGSALVSARARCASISGHSGSVLCILVDPSGRWLASAGADGTVRLWDTGSGRLLHVLEGHLGRVLTLTVPSDGRWLASAGDDGAVRLWDLAKGQVLHILDGHEGWVGALTTAPDGRWLASAGADGTVRLWNTETGRALYVLKGHRGRVLRLAVAPDGRWLASAGDDGRVRMWDLANGQVLHILDGHEGLVAALTIAPDGCWLASAGVDGFVRLWDTASAQLLHSLDGHGSWPGVLAVAPDGRWLAAAGADGIVRLWDPMSGRELSTLEGHESPVRVLAAAPNGNWLASTDLHGTVRLWEPVSGRLLHVLEWHGGIVEALTACPKANWLASAADDGSVRLWDPATGRALLTLERHERGTSSMTVAPDGQWLASVSLDGTVHLLDPTSGRDLHAMEALGSRGGLLASAPDGRWLALAGTDSRVRLWDVVSGRLLHVFDGHQFSVSALAATPDGNWLAVADHDGRLDLWDTASGQALRVLEGPQFEVFALAAAPNGHWLASAGLEGTVHLWDPANGRALQVLVGPRMAIRALATAPDGRWLASGGADGTVRMWDPATGLTLHVLKGDQLTVDALAVAPDGRWLASASGDTVRLWDPASGEVLHVLEGHGGMVSALAPGPDGRWLVSAGAGGTLRFWDPASGQALWTLKRHRNDVFRLVSDPNGRWLASAGADGWVRLWTLPSDGTKPFCATAIEHLPEGNWVVWRDPDGPNRRWVRWSRDAWRWLGWHAPLPDGEHWMFYPMDAFRSDPEPDE